MDLTLFSFLKDAIELDQLITYLIDKESSNGVILLGHSTGCQVRVSEICNINVEIEINIIDNSMVL